jgi:transcriptional regulator with XRE-family HTH domain
MSTDLGNNIRKFRKNKGFTQEELADLLNVTPQAVSRWESAGGYPDVSLLVPIAQVLNVSTDALLGYDTIAENEEINKRIEATVESMKDDKDRPGSALRIAEYLATETSCNPANYELIKDYVQSVANLSQYEDPQLEDCFKEDKERIHKLYKDAVKKGTYLISHSTDRALIDKTHYGITWIYIHMKDFDKAREHVEVLPSLKSNRLKEFLDAEIVFFEKGFDDMKDVLAANNVHLFKTMTGIFHRECENYGWQGDKDEAVARCEWCENVLRAYAENKEAIDEETYIRLRAEISFYKMVALTRAGDRKAAEVLYAEFVEEINCSDLSSELKVKAKELLDSNIAYFSKYE